MISLSFMVHRHLNEGTGHRLAVDRRHARRARPGRPENSESTSRMPSGRVNGTPAKSCRGSAPCPEAPGTRGTSARGRVRVGASTRPSDLQIDATRAIVKTSRSCRLALPQRDRGWGTGAIRPRNPAFRALSSEEFPYAIRLRVAGRSRLAAARRADGLTCGWGSSGR
jgi:hypothetical protein